MRIEALTSQDIDLVMDLGRIVHDEDAANGLRAWLASTDAAREYAGKPVMLFGIKSDDGRLVATAGVGQSWESRIIYGFGELMTHPDFRCRGFGTALVALRAAWIYVWTANRYVAPLSSDEPTILHATDVPNFHSRFGYRTLFNHRPVSNSAMVMSVSADKLLATSTRMLMDKYRNLLALPLHVADAVTTIGQTLLAGWAQAPKGKDLVAVKGIKSGGIIQHLEMNDLPVLLASVCVTAHPQDCKNDTVAMNVGERIRPNETLRFCPYCGGDDISVAANAFVEMGKFDGRRYEAEGDATGMRCNGCGGEFFVDGPKMVSHSADA